MGLRLRSQRLQTIHPAHTPTPTTATMFSIFSPFVVVPLHPGVLRLMQYVSRLDG